MRGKSMRQPTFFMDFRYDYTGNLSLLDKPTVAFFASRVVSPSVEEQALRWAGGVLRNRSRRNQRFPISARKIPL